MRVDMANRRTPERIRITRQSPHRFERQKPACHRDAASMARMTAAIHGISGARLLSRPQTPHVRQVLLTRIVPFRQQRSLHPSDVAAGPIEPSPDTVQERRPSEPPEAPAYVSVAGGDRPQNAWCCRNSTRAARNVTVRTPGYRAKINSRSGTSHAAANRHQKEGNNASSCLVHQTVRQCPSVASESCPAYPKTAATVAEPRGARCPGAMTISMRTQQCEDDFLSESTTAEESAEQRTRSGNCAAPRGLGRPPHRADESRHKHPAVTQYPCSAPCWPCWPRQPDSLEPGAVPAQ